MSNILTPEQDWARRHSIDWVLDAHAAQPNPNLTEEDLFAVSPRHLRQSLYVPVAGHDADYPTGYRGIIFPSGEFHIVARSPEDLAIAVHANTRKAHDADPDKLSAEAMARRSARHALESKIGQLVVLEQGLGDQLASLRILKLELGMTERYPNLTRRSGNGLLEHLQLGEKAIRLALKTVAEQQAWPEADYKRGALALEDRLYGTRGAERRHIWAGFVQVTGVYVKRRIDAIVRSRQITQKAITPYLDEDIAA